MARAGCCLALGFWSEGRRGSDAQGWPLTISGGKREAPLAVEGHPPDTKRATPGPCLHPGSASSCCVVDQVATVKPAFELPPLAAYRVSRCLRRRVLPGGWHGGNAALRPPCGQCLRGRFQPVHVCRAAACEEPAPHDGACCALRNRRPASERLRADWPPNAHVPLELVDCPGRSLAGCAVDLIRHEAELPGAEVTVILPRHSIAAPIGRTGRDLACRMAWQARSPRSWARRPTSR